MQQISTLRLVEEEQVIETLLTELSEPIAADSPCGVSLDETQTLGAIEAFRVFGRLTASETEPDWRQLKKACLEALKTSKDLRVLAHFTAASAHTDALPEVLRILPLVQTWLSQYWDTVYPLIDDDAIMRRNALNLFADRVAVVDVLRRMPLVKDSRFGSFSVRDFEIASGLLQQKSGDAAPVATDVIHAALSAVDNGSLRELSDTVVSAAAAMRSVEEVMLSRGGGSGMVPQLDDVIATLQRMQEMLAPHVVDNPVQSPAASASETSQGELPAAREGQVGSVSSRQDVLRALDAINGYYSRQEPSSLVPMLVERVKRLVSMNFLEALAEVAPEALDPVRKAVGVRDPSS